MVNPISNVIHVTQNSHLASVVAGSEKAKFDLQALSASEKSKADLARIAKMDRIKELESINPDEEHEKEQGREQSHYTEEIEKLMKKHKGHGLTEEEAEMLKEENDGDMPHTLDITA
jgi:poly(3-hydroxybutyrate) depolymerase